ncbi:MAG: flavodoxin domain-containing protein [Dehalococcoidales bacterium]|nr:flavodoxin domain-containing protein [Dehalococcoidales bacterium]
MVENRNENELKALVLYWSATGNTGKVALAIQQALTAQGLKPVVRKIGEAAEEDLYDYNLVFLGTPSYMWQPPAPVLDFIKAKMDQYRKRGSIKLCAPRIQGKRSVTFVTYSGPHTGIEEAIPVGKYVNQFFRHLGFEPVGEWYVVGEFHGSEENSTKGLLGDIRGRPSTQDLSEVESKVSALIKSIRN